MIYIEKTIIHIDSSLTEKKTLQSNNQYELQGDKSLRKTYLQILTIKKYEYLYIHSLLFSTFNVIHITWMYRVSLSSKRVVKH